MFLSFKKKKRVVSIDNLSNSKRKNFHKNISFFKVNIKEKKEIEKIFKQYKFETVIHLAAKIDARESNLKKNKYSNLKCVQFYKCYDSV